MLKNAEVSLFKFSVRFSFNLTILIKLVLEKVIMPALPAWPQTFMAKVTIPLTCLFIYIFYGTKLLPTLLFNLLPLLSHINKWYFSLALAELSFNNKAIKMSLFWKVVYIILSHSFFILIYLSYLYFSRHMCLLIKLTDVYV